MSLKLGANTQAAILRIAETLPFIKADGDSAIPSAQREAVTGIRRNAANKANGPRDVQIDAAREWAETELTRALEADNKADEPKPQTKPDTAPEPPPEVKIVRGAVVKKPVGEVSDAKPDEGPKEGK